MSLLGVVASARIVKTEAALRARKMCRWALENAADVQLEYPETPRLSSHRGSDGRAYKWASGSTIYAEIEGGSTDEQQARIDTVLATTDALLGEEVSIASAEAAGEPANLTIEFVTSSEIEDSYGDGVEGYAGIWYNGEGHIYRATIELSNQASMSVYYHEVGHALGVEGHRRKEGDSVMESGIPPHITHYTEMDLAFFSAFYRPQIEAGSTIEEVVSEVNSGGGSTQATRITPGHFEKHSSSQ